MESDRITILGTYLLGVEVYQLTYDARGEQRNFRCADRNSAITAQEVLKGNIYDLAAIRSSLGSGVKTVLDIGANMGAFSVLVSHAWPGSRVLAFEPGAKSFACLTDNVVKYPGVRAFHYGLAKGDMSLTMRDPGNGAIGMTVGAVQGATMARAGADETIAVRDAGRVFAEEGIDAVDILKVDTEGCEVPIFASMGSLAASARVIYVEYHSEEDRRTLDAMLAPSHLAFSGRVICPHRGEFCYLRRDLCGPWDGTRIRLPEAFA